MPISESIDESEQPGRGRGRPRLVTDDAILQATRDLLAEDGYNRLSYEAVARRAGVTRPTIYRRWASKTHLVHEAVFPVQHGPLVADTGDLRADVRRLIARSIATYARPEVRAAIPGLLTDLQDDPGLQAQLVGRLETMARHELERLIGRAIARGDARPDANADLLLDVITGTIVYRLVSRNASDEFADVLARVVLDGIAIQGR